MSDKHEHNGTHNGCCQSMGGGDTPGTSHQLPGATAFSGKSPLAAEVRSALLELLQPDREELRRAHRYIAELEARVERMRGVIEAVEAERRAACQTVDGLQTAVALGGALIQQAALFVLDAREGKDANYRTADFDVPPVGKVAVTIQRAEGITPMQRLRQLTVLAAWNDGELTSGQARVLLGVDSSELADLNAQNNASALALLEQYVAQNPPRRAQPQAKAGNP